MTIQSETERRKEILYKKRNHNAPYLKILYAVVAILLLFVGYYTYISINNKKDFVAQSRNVYESISNNEVKLRYVTSNAKELADLIGKSVDFVVFIPEVKDAVLIGGTVNEMNGLKVVHFVHLRKNEIIYTLQADKNGIMNSDNFSIHKNHIQEILNGKNWIPCENIGDDCTVIWFKNDVICSSVSHFEAQEMASILTNYK